ncbi:MAG: hypothetical protein MZV70_43605 [Desulfobacterales bacterium]|nr:hypothetical protein [Desulfobacterales bacterium]
MLQKVTGLIGEIAAASREQAQGISEVSTAINEMNGVTQQTAASAEESASASEELNAQAELMRGYVTELSAFMGIAASIPDRRCCDGNAEDQRLRSADGMKVIAACLSGQNIFSLNQHVSKGAETKKKPPVFAGGFPEGY